MGDVEVPTAGGHSVALARSECGSCDDAKCAGMSVWRWVAK